MPDTSSSGRQKRIASKRRTGRRKAGRHDIVYYIVAIDAWDWSFMFSAAHLGRQHNEPQRDYRHLQIFGRLIRPTKMKADAVELTFLPNYQHNEQHSRPPVQIVGSIDYRRGRFTGLMTMPTDALPPILQMLIADKFRFVVMSGTPTRYGHATVTSYRLEMKIDDDDLPPD